MALIHATTLRDTLANAVDDAINFGATDAQGDFLLLAAADAQVAAIALANPAFDTAAGDGIIVLNSTPLSDPAADGGVAIAFIFRNRNNVEQVRGSVTGIAGGGDIEMSSTTVGVNDTVTMTSFSYAAPA